MVWTKEEIINEVLDTMDFSPSEEEEGLYTDNQHVWEDKNIETLIFYTIDNVDRDFNYINCSEDEKKSCANWIVDFCKSAKELFNMGTDLDIFVEEYEEYGK